METKDIVTLGIGGAALYIGWKLYSKVNQTANNANALMGNVNKAANAIGSVSGSLSAISNAASAVANGVASIFSLSGSSADNTQVAPSGNSSQPVNNDSWFSDLTNWNANPGTDTPDGNGWVSEGTGGEF